ncbi:MAG: glycosyltransferase family 2 protein [Hyphomicrobiales bacterium]|nr:glycosyltransferase family 2 protein [Hyphomicrobiales bacterium]
MPPLRVTFTGPEIAAGAPARGGALATGIVAIVVVRDSAAVLPSCLAALAREGLATIVVDNASTDASAAIAEGAGARVIRNAVNQGYGRAMNIGMRAARHSTCLLLNPDLVLAPGSLDALSEAMTRYPDAGLLAPRLVEPDGRLFFQPRSMLSPYLANEAGLPCEPEGDCCTPFLSGACLLADRELVLSLGGFDEEIFLFYEDDDLCRRVCETGRSLVHVHAAQAAHLRGGSSQMRPGSVYKARWHRAWSAGYVARKYALRNPCWGILLVNALKWSVAAIAFRGQLRERYGGSAAGAFAWLTGRRALSHEGLS